MPSPRISPMFSSFVEVSFRRAKRGGIRSPGATDSSSFGLGMTPLCLKNGFQFAFAVRVELAQARGDLLHEEPHRARPLLAGSVVLAAHHQQRAEPATYIVVVLDQLVHAVRAAHKIVAAIHDVVPG